MVSVNYNGTTYAVVGGGVANGSTENLVRFIRFNGAGCYVEKSYTLTTGRKNTTSSMRCATLAVDGIEYAIFAGGVNSSQSELFTLQGVSYQNGVTNELTLPTNRYNYSLVTMVHENKQCLFVIGG